MGGVRWKLQAREGRLVVNGKELDTFVHRKSRTVTTTYPEIVDALREVVAHALRWV